MKILKIVFISLVVLVFLLVIGAIVFLKTFNINRYKLQIINQVSAILSRQVNFDSASLGISLARGVNLKINNFVIAEDPAFGKEEFLTVKEASFTVDVLGYLFKKKINIPGILIDNCRVNVIRKKDGSINILTIAKTAQDREKKQIPAQAAAPLAIPALLINSLSLNNATITYADQTFEPAINLTISSLNVKLNRFSLFEAFPFSAEASFLSDKKNIRLDGKAQIDLKTNQVTISELKGTSNLSQILIERILFSLPMTKGAILPKSINGELNFVLTKLIAGPEGLLDMKFDASIVNGSLLFQEITSPVKDVRIILEIDKDKVILNESSAAIGEGTINYSGQIQDYLNKQDFNFVADAQNLKIQDLISQDNSPVKAEGIAECQIKVKGQGISPKALKSSLSGDLDLSLKQTKLKDINILRTVLDKISVIPGLSEKIEANLSERFKQKLTQKDTTLQDIKLPITISDGALQIKEAVLASDEFTFKGSGQAAFDSTFTLEGSFLIPQELSASMVSAVSQLQYLLNDANQIYLPLKVTGNAADVKFNLDAEYIAKRLITEQATKQIFKALDKALGIEKPGQTEQNTLPDESNKEPSTKDALKNIFNDIFKK